jgi:hypothetical protein
MAIVQTPISQPRTTPNGSMFEFADFDDAVDTYYDDMQEEVELTMLRQGHGVRRSPRFRED